MHKKISGKVQRVPSLRWLKIFNPGLFSQLTLLQHGRWDRMLDSDCTDDRGTDVGMA